MPTPSIVETVKDAAALRDGDAFELALNEAWRSGLTPCLAGPLASALEGTWHTRHEDVVNALQELRDPGTVDALFRAATIRHEYLEFDDGRALARKCTWALADIGTAEARSKLTELADGPDEIVAAYAQERLARWDAEAGRKGGGLRP